MTLITRLEAAAEGSRELDAEIAAREGIQSRPRRDSRGRSKGREWLEDSHGGVSAWRREPPPYTQSLDAKIRGEDIHRVERVDTDSGYLWTAYQRHEFGAARTEILARRIAALKAREQEIFKVCAEVAGSRLFIQNTAAIALEAAGFRAVAADDEEAARKIVIEYQLDTKIGRAVRLIAAIAAALTAARAPLVARVAHLERGCSTQNQEVMQTLGKALGYPWYKDDPKNFPNATEADGICPGEHVAESMAAEAATKITTLVARVEALEKWKNDSLDTLHAICVKGLGWTDPLTHHSDVPPPEWNSGKISDDVKALRERAEAAEAALAKANAKLPEDLRERVMNRQERQT
jgi:hypothetical protein